MAGDPCQLPPVVTAPAAVTPRPAAVASASAAVGDSSAAAIRPASAAAGPVTPAVGPAAAAMELAATAVGAATAATGTASAAVGRSTAASCLQQPLQESLAGGSAACVRNPATAVGLQGMARALLVRLIQMGHKAHLLRTQYRQPLPPLARACNNRALTRGRQMLSN